MFHFARLFVLSLAIVCAVTEALPLSAQPKLVSLRKPDGLILSTDNLYFTSHDDAGAAVWRMAQSSIPDQEGVLYWEAGAKFGDIVFAQVDGSFFGYFFAQNAAGVTTIKRVRLEGGNATVLVTVTGVDVANSHRNLITDGVNLYWQDVSSVRKMPIGGGTVSVLDRTTNTPTAGLAQRSGVIIYADGANIRSVPKRRVSTTTPLARTIATASSRVTALYAEFSAVYWGEQGGAVRWNDGSTTTTLSSDPGSVITSISRNAASGGGIAWTLCRSQSCQLSYGFGASHYFPQIGADAFGVTVTSGNAFWGDAAGVHRMR
jgi:hypothetical protein